MNGFEDESSGEGARVEQANRTRGKIPSRICHIVIKSTGDKHKRDAIENDKDFVLFPLYLSGNQ